MGQSAILSKCGYRFLVSMMTIIRSSTERVAKEFPSTHYQLQMHGVSVKLSNIDYLCSGAAHIRPDDHTAHPPTLPTYTDTYEMRACVRKLSR